MSATTENLTLLATLLAHTLDPANRKQAENQLAQAQAQPGFPQLLLALIQNTQLQNNPAVRLAAAIRLKNISKAAWSPDAQDDPATPPLLSHHDKHALKDAILPLLVALSTTSPDGTPPAPTSLRAQLEDTIATIAEADFPHQWPTLMDHLVPHLKSDDFELVQGVLRTAHTIFYRWRSAFRSDALYSQINFVLERFALPLLELLQRLDRLLVDPATPSAALAPLGRCLVLLLQTFYDLSAQDLPPQFEDNMAPIADILVRWISQRRAELDAGDDDEVCVLQEIRSSICEIAELYAKRYLDAFPQLPTFVQAVWEMLKTCTPAEKYDVLVSKAVGFLSTVVRMGSQREMFQDAATIEQLCSAIVLPNIVLREADEELFEEQPIEYIRRDFETSVENDTRRKAASEFCRALMEHFTGEVTAVVSRYIGDYLGEYRADPAANWKQKDTAIYLLTSIALRGSTMQQGVTTTNTLVDVVQFFGEHVFSDLQASADESPSAILQVDAIKYLYTFRNQLTKEQLVSVLPLLVKHLESAQYVTCSYASITIERVLALKREGRLVFTAEDVGAFGESVLMAVFRNIERGTTPEKVAENDYLMKCAMRMVATWRGGIAAVHAAVLEHLVRILSEVSRNPSNPRFNQYLFEAVSALIRYTVAQDASCLSTFEARLFGPFTQILANDVAEFAPYVFQILAQMLELRKDEGGLPGEYAALLPPILMPALWEQRGNVPALVRLIKAFLKKDADAIVANGQLQSILGIYQRLIASKVNDGYGFELVEVVFEVVPSAEMEAYKRPVLTLMLTRLQSSKTDKFVKGFATFVATLACLRKEGYPEYVVEMFEAVQPGLFAQLIPLLLPVIPTLRTTRATLGFGRLLLSSPFLSSPSLVALWPKVCEAMLLNFLVPAASSTGGEEEVEFQDVEDGFQNAFSRLAASQTRSSEDVAAWVGDVKVWWRDMVKREEVKALYQTVEAGVRERFEKL
ncbi:importin-alpha export receptor [Thecaphora frezii]